MSRKHTLGFSLVELMVAMLISLFLIGGVLAVYSQGRDTQIVNEAIGRIQENARFTLDVLEKDIRLAGYWGMTNDAQVLERRRGQIGELADIDDCGERWYIDANLPVEAGNNVNPLGAASADPCIDDAAYREDTDVLVVRHASTSQVPPTANVVQIHSDVGRARLFDDGVVPPGFPATAQTFNMVANAYYVSVADGEPALHRVGLGPGPALVDEQIVPGVEDFQVQFGIDTDDDNTADQYVNPGNEPANSSIVAVRIWLLMRSESPEIGFEDDGIYTYADKRVVPADGGPDGLNRRRLLVTKTIQVRNTPVGLAL